MNDGRQLAFVTGVMLLLTVLTICTAASAQEMEAAAEEQVPNTGNVSLEAGADVTTHYFFRGALQEDAGFIAQPYGSIAIEVYEGDGAIDSASVSAGIWNSFHSKQTGAMTTSDGPDSWYEADLSAGASLTVYEKWEAGVSYIAYTSPNDAFDTIEEIDVTLSYDDSALWGDNGFALNPSATLAIEIDNTLLGMDEGRYLGVGVAPSFDLITRENREPITLDVPVTVGLGLDDYYEDASGDNDEFGFLSVKPTVNVPMDFIPADYGAWTLSAGIDLLLLGDTNEALNNGDDFEAVGVVGVSMSY